jgi:hypothetical protein
MDNKIKHSNPTQTIPEMEFLPILRGEAPYYGNLNRPAQSAYNLANTVAQVQSWGGTISILQPVDQGTFFTLYEIAQITDNEVLAKATNTDAANTRYGIVVAEAEFDSVTGTYANIVVCTFCPNFVYPTGAEPNESAGASLYLDIVDATKLSAIASGTYVTRVLAKKTGTHSIFFSGTASLW